MVDQGRTGSRPEPGVDELLVLCCPPAALDYEVPVHLAVARLVVPHPPIVACRVRAADAGPRGPGVGIPDHAAVVPPVFVPVGPVVAVTVDRLRLLVIQFEVVVGTSPLPLCFICSLRVRTGEGEVRLEDLLLDSIELVQHSRGRDLHKFCRGDTVSRNEVL